MSERSWVRAGIDPAAYEQLTRGLSASRLWSLLIDVMGSRAVRTPASLMEQWERDRFVAPGLVDQRTAMDVDRHLFAAAPDFEAVELSPVAPLGVCSSMGRTSQHKVLAALRGTEVVADPTNVMALECARRLRQDRDRVVRLATSHRCVRAQAIPSGRRFTAGFRIFCLASAAAERQNHAFVVGEAATHLKTMLHALDRLEQEGFAIAERHVTVLTSRDRKRLGDRVAAQFPDRPISRALLTHPYYDGLRFQVAVRATDGTDVPLIDGGVLNWVAHLTSNRRHVYVASGLGSQLIPLLFQHSP